MIYADVVNLLGENTHTIKKSTEALLVISKEDNLEVNAPETNYMFMSCEQNVGQSHNTKIGNNFKVIHPSRAVNQMYIFPSKQSNIYNKLPDELAELLSNKKCFLLQLKNI